MIELVIFGIAMYALVLRIRVSELEQTIDHMRQRR